MFEVIISMVRTGRVQRRLFDTREEAERYADERREAWVNPKPRGDRPVKCRSARDLRIEIEYRDVPAIRQLMPAAPAQAAVA
jgi:hypothetical protein